MWWWSRLTVAERKVKVLEDKMKEVDRRVAWCMKMVADGQDGLRKAAEDKRQKAKEDADVEKVSPNPT